MKIMWLESLALCIWLLDHPPLVRTYIHVLSLLFIMNCNNVCIHACCFISHVLLVARHLVVFPLDYLITAFFELN